MSLDTERKRALFDWLGTVRVMSYGPPVSDVSDRKERESIALWLDKQIGSFLEWQMMRKDEKVVLERTDYYNDHFTYEPVGTVLAIDPKYWPPPAKGTHESDFGVPIGPDGPLDLLHDYDDAAEWSRS